MSTRVKRVAPLVVWTLVVWLSRIRNIWTDDTLSSSGQVIRTVVALVFLTLGVGAARILWVRRRQDLDANDRVYLAVFVAWTVGFWVVRGVGIIVDDHSASFTAIHTLLMVVSIALSALASTVLGSRRSVSSSPIEAH